MHSSTSLKATASISLNSADLLEGLALDGEAGAGNRRDLMRRGRQPVVAALGLQKADMGMAGNALDAEHGAAMLHRVVGVEEPRTDRTDVGKPGKVNTPAKRANMSTR